MMMGLLIHGKLKPQNRIYIDKCRLERLPTSATINPLG
jgi:hypothetical protein